MAEALAFIICGGSAAIGLLLVAMLLQSPKEPPDLRPGRTKKMAADLSGAGAPDPWSWGNVVGVAGGIMGIIGGPVLLQKLVEHFSGRKKASAEADLANANAAQIKENMGAEFEKAVNDRVKAVLDSWARQVEMLTARISAQQTEIGELRNEVVELRKALDAATKALHSARGVQGFGQ